MVKLNQLRHFINRDTYAQNKYKPLTDEERWAREERRERLREKEKEKKVERAEERNKILSEKVKRMINEEYNQGMYGG